MHTMCLLHLDGPGESKHVEASWCVLVESYYEMSARHCN